MAAIAVVHFDATIHVPHDTGTHDTGTHDTGTGTHDTGTHDY
nr:hypothetical protein [Rubripirellula sp.]